MRPTPSPESVLPAPWTAILANIEQSLVKTLAEAAEREQALTASLPATPAADREAVWQAQLEQCDARLRGLRSCLQQAERDAAGADAALQACEQAVQDWLAAAELVRQKLAEGDAPPV